jgi:hypothetical protein
MVPVISDLIIALYWHGSCNVATRQIEEAASVRLSWSGYIGAPVIRKTIATFPISAAPAFAMRSIGNAQDSVESFSSCFRNCVGFFGNGSTTGVHVASHRLRRFGGTCNPDCRNQM